MKRLVVIGFTIAVFTVSYLAMQPDPEPEVQVEQARAQPSGGPLAQVTVPAQFSQQAIMGRTAFDAKCAACHGAAAVGQQGVAPPLVHRIYEPSHHGDEAFQRAVSLGVQAHHWTFGNMPQIDGLTRGDVTMIIAYVRELQQANGVN